MNNTMAVYDRVIKRPLILYHGSKFRIAEWIISFFPSHRIFVDLFGGSASVLLKKTRSEIEVYNDLDKEIVNLMKIVRDRGNELIQKLLLTPYSREEFINSFLPADDPLEQARRTVVRAFQGYGGSYVTKGTKATINNSFKIVYKRGNRPQVSWASYPENLYSIIEMLKGVCIENIDFRKAIKRYYQKDALIYADPPYLTETRDYGRYYNFELSEEDHIQLAKLLNEREGPAIVSCYHSELYEKLYKEWVKKETTTRDASNKKRTELLFIKGLNNQPIQKELF